jgi:hypothetical protein
MTAGVPAAQVDEIRRRATGPRYRVILRGSQKSTYSIKGFQWIVTKILISQRQATLRFRGGGFCSHADNGNPD